MQISALIVPFQVPPEERILLACMPVLLITSPKLRAGYKEICLKAFFVSIKAG